MGIQVYELLEGHKLIKIIDFPESSTFDDLSKQLPQGVYTTFRTYGGAKKALGFQLHMDRLYKPAERLGIKPVISEDVLRTNLRDLLNQFNLTEARVRLSMSIKEKAGRLFVMLDKLKLIDEAVYSHGVKVVTSEVQRVNPRLKSTSFISNSAHIRQDLLTGDTYEILMVQNGKILEGVTSNFYSLANDQIITAREKILLGVTRRVVLRLIRKEHYGICYRPLRIDELPSVKEAFITSSSRGVVPVVSIDGKPVGQGRPGSLSTKLRSIYENYVNTKAETI